MKPTFFVSVPVAVTIGFFFHTFWAIRALKFFLKINKENFWDYFYFLYLGLDVGTQALSKVLDNPRVNSEKVYWMTSNLHSCLKEHRCLKKVIHYYYYYYLFIYSRIIKIKIKVYNNMQLKYVKNKIKQQHKSKTVA